MLDILTLIETIKSTSILVFSLGGGAVIWRSIKQFCFANLNKEVEYIAACEATKESIWLHRFLKDLEVVPDVDKPIRLYSVDSSTMAHIKEPRNY